MIFLLFSILSSTAIFLIFKLIDIKKVPGFNVILINYFIAALLGFSLNKSPQTIMGFITSDAFWFSFLIGFLFIVMFFVIGWNSQKSGLAVTSVASKMSVVMPISFSIIYFNETISGTKIIGIIFALLAVFFTVYRKKEKENSKSIFLPVILFLGMGLVDISVKYVQEKFITPEINSFFTAFLFLISAFFAVIFTFFNKKTLKDYKIPKVWFFGFALGIVNFGTIYFLIATLNSKIFSSPVVFGINNTGIVLLSFLLGLLFFKEKLLKINILGIVLSIAAIFLLTFSNV
ncbi:MAG TPA: hypothetical protein EYG89_02805 [Bacteroidia bacterium]|nr:hypothetical protein [Bacteroidia bacterium]